LDYYVGGGYERERGWRDATNGENANGFLNVGRRGAQRRVSVQAYGVRSRVETAGSLPESLFGSTPRNAS
jgi:hypothetical protein